MLNKNFALAFILILIKVRWKTGIYKMCVNVDLNNDKFHGRAKRSLMHGTHCLNETATLTSNSHVRTKH